MIRLSDQINLPVRKRPTTKKDLILNEKKTHISHFWNQVYPYHVSRKLSQITIELARSLILQKKKNQSRDIGVLVVYDLFFVIFVSQFQTMPLHDYRNV